MSTTETSISLRAACPTVEGGLVFAELLEQAQEGSFRWMLGPHVIDILGRAFVEPDHDFSYEHVTFAEQAEEVVGMSSGYCSASHVAFTMEPLETAAGPRRLRMTAFLRLADRKFRFLDNLPTGDSYVRALAVHPEHRGAGIGTVPLGRLEEDARASGSKRLALDVAAKNRGGRRLYERFGLTVEAESPRWFGIPNTNIIRMVKPL
jgi:ribosomal protein S18 acetylase RimI-like enzyme